MLTATIPALVPAQPAIPSRRRSAQPPTLSLPQALGELGHIATLSPMLAVREGSRVLAHLLNNPEFLAGQGSALLTTPAAPGPYVAWQVLGPQNAYALQVFVWPPGAKTAIHDHSCWGLIHGAFGTLREERFMRLDAGEHAAQARLSRTWRSSWSRADGVSTLLPYEGGIHRVSNPSNQPALSVHIYGPPGAIDGRDYDPSHDYVCDRLVEDTPIALTLQAAQFAS
jgi:predicted metal-dependent enzyme (double-stranded beta helix superfamily)